MFFDFEGIGSGDFERVILGNIQERAHFLVLLTPHSVKSMWVKRELNYALIEKRYEDRIVPLLFKKCNYRALSWTLPQFQMIDFTKEYEQACEELLRVWKKPLRSRARRKRDQKPG